MSDVFDSVYPDLLKTGLGKLNRLDARRELLALFSALEHLRRDLHAQDSASGILQVSRQYVEGLDLFRTTGFWLVNPKDMAFELALAAPRSEAEALACIVRHEIKTGRFAWALRQGEPVFFQAGTAQKPISGVFHSLEVSSQVVGMFCGLLRSQLAPVHEIAFSLLSLMLGASADGLATLGKTTQLTSQIETLSGLLPVCAWCKKVRNDSGYWEQIERYISSRSAASFTHSICPDCQKKFEEQASWSVSGAQGKR
jgi:hypothetical protein